MREFMMHEVLDHRRSPNLLHHFFNTKEEAMPGSRLASLAPGAVFSTFTGYGVKRR